MSAPEDDGFLQRWLRRKNEAAAGGSQVVHVILSKCSKTTIRFDCAFFFALLLAEPVPYSPAPKENVNENKVMIDTNFLRVIYTPFC